MFRFILLLLLHSVVATVTEPSLYSAEDNVKILNNDTLELQLYSPHSCKLVQFINYFCGDCRRFAGTYKQLAWKLYGWQRVLSIYVVDCAQERNVKICRDFDIRKTPTLRLYPPAFQRTEQKLGFQLDTLVPDDILVQLAEFVGKVKYTAFDQPNFEPLTAEDTKKTLLNHCTTTGIKYIVLVHQPEGSTLGRDTILGLLTWPIVAVRILSDRRLFDNFGLSSTSDSLIIMDCLGKSFSLQPQNDSSTAYVTSVQKYLQSKAYTALLPHSTTTAPNVTSYLVDEEQAAILATVLQGAPKIYRADLEQAIDKLLHIELPKVRVFAGESLFALRQLLNVMHRFSPLNRSGNILLARLYEFVNGFGGDELSGFAFQAQVQLLESMLPKVFKAKRYVGCIASGPFLRGFTCSLWTLFHYLTVQTARSPVLPAGFVLGTIHGFVRQFFGCKDCVQHFLGMAERRRIFSVASRDEEILWLWEAHNEVNQRLAGDSTEDPKFPKIQFPSRTICDKCQMLTPQNTTWRRPEVLEFLTRLYAVKNLSNYGLPTAIGYE
ncbi:sulfhydryl oxidase 1 [Drosophila novamexicana]|uniref:sulfhydryl oxidase 1 n=1 Tax=Drosophila novamexicana TaxID=47314 RepID=UPI0011E5CEF2|nr:sulfhydryl oxidase 1 [Drosophila novamexicana]